MPGHEVSSFPEPPLSVSTLTLRLEVGHSISAGYHLIHGSPTCVYREWVSMDMTQRPGELSGIGGQIWRVSNTFFGRQIIALSAFSKRFMIQKV